MKLYSAAITLILVMDPLGNIPIFLSLLNKYPLSRQRKIIIRESLIAFLILVTFLFFGNHILNALQISMPALSMAGGIILFLIALKMIFPVKGEYESFEEEGEPLLVPLAIPLTAGPSALAMVMLFSTQAPDRMGTWLLAVVIATLLFILIMMSAPYLMKFLGVRGLKAMERLMGMILTIVAIQMFLTGINQFLLVKVI